MDSYNFSPPLPIDFEETCSDCGRELENGPRTICDYCNKRYQQEAELESRMALEPDLSHSDEEHRPFWESTPEEIEEEK